MESPAITPQNCLIVEDLPATAQWLSELVEQTFPGITIHSCDSVRSGHAMIADQDFDLALLDLGLPDGSGLELIRELTMRQPQCIRIVTTIYTDDQHVFPALRAGAQGYVLKDQPPHKVGQALIGITLGEPPLSPVIARRLLRVFSDEDPQRDQDKRLTQRETETLALVAKGLKIGEVAEQMHITANTAAGYVKAIYRKLNISNRAEATVEAARLGLIRTEI